MDVKPTNPYCNFRKGKNLTFCRENQQRGIFWNALFRKMDPHA